MIFSRLFKSTPPPTTSADNPGRAVEMRWKTEQGLSVALNSVHALAVVLRAAGFKLKERTEWVELEMGLKLLPRFVEVSRDEKGSWRTITTIEAQHGELFPAGVFEYQHARGETLPASCQQGFEQFAEMDLPLLCEVVTGNFSKCTRIEMPERSPEWPLPGPRRVVLGPVSWQVAGGGGSAEAGEPHSFCPCCFFTRTSEVMKDKLCTSGFFGVRCYAARLGKDQLVADCRVNGIDWPEGKAALLAYAATWPDRGIEGRKQYIVFSDLR